MLRKKYHHNLFHNREIILHPSRAAKAAFFQRETKVADELYIEACTLGAKETYPYPSFEEVITAFSKAAYAGSIKAAALLGEMFDPSQCLITSRHLNFGLEQSLVRFHIPMEHESFYKIKNLKKAIHYYHLGLQQGDLNCTQALIKMFTTEEEWSTKFKQVDEQLFAATYYQQCIDTFYQFLKNTINVALYEKDNFEKTREYNEKLFSRFSRYFEQEILEKLQSNPAAFDEITQDYLFATLAKIMQSLTDYISVQLYSQHFVELYANPLIDQDLLKKYQFVAMLEFQFRTLFDKCCDVGLKQANSFIFTLEENEKNPTKAFELLENISDHSTHYAEAQYLMSIIISQYSNFTPSSFADESNENKIERFEAILPYLERAATLGHELAGREYAKVLEKLAEIQELVHAPENERKSGYSP